MSKVQARQQDFGHWTLDDEFKCSFRAGGETINSTPHEISTLMDFILCIIPLPAENVNRAKCRAKCRGKCRAKCRAKCRGKCRGKCRAKCRARCRARCRGIWPTHHLNRNSISFRSSGTHTQRPEDGAWPSARRRRSRKLRSRSGGLRRIRRMPSTTAVSGTSRHRRGSA